MTDIGTTTARSDLASMVSYINKKIPTDAEKEAYVIVKKPSKSYIQSMVNKNASGSYYVSIDELYNVTINHFAQQMAY